MSNSSHPSLHQLRSVLLAASLLTAAGCTDTDKPLPSIDGGVSFQPRGETGPCEEGEQRTCSETLEYGNGVMTCFHGTQTCEDGEYSPCQDGVITTEVAPPIKESRGKRETLSLSSPATCDDPMSAFFNACDPGCRYFDEDPPDIVATPYNPPPPPTYNGNPVSTICNADPCVVSTGPLDYGCSDCVTAVCDDDMTCCTTEWTQACVNSALFLCEGITVPEVPGLCGFGLYSDGVLTTANRPATNAMIGSYGDLTIGTDADLQGGGILTAGDLEFKSLNGKDIIASQGIYADGDITSEDSPTTLTGDMYSGGTIFLPKWELDAGYTVAGQVNVTGLNGTTSYGTVKTRGATSGITLSGSPSNCTNMMSCYTHTPVELPPKTAGTAIPTLPTVCTGTDGPWFTNGGTQPVTPGVHGAVNITNNGNLILNGEGTYYFTSFYVDGGSIILEPDMGGAVGWDVRVCNNVEFRDGTIVAGGTGLTNDVTGVLLDPSLLRFYADTSSDIALGGTGVFFSGIFMAPNAKVTKGNINGSTSAMGALYDQPPHRPYIAAGTRAAPINGAIWARTLELGTDGLTYQIPEAVCEGLNIPGTTDGPGVYPSTCPISNVLPASSGALLSPCESGADCQMNYRCDDVATDASCGHSKCSTGGGLTSTCDPCVEQICAVDSTCCSGMWTASCVAMVDTVCDAVCGSTGGGSCTDNADGFTESCGGYDLALGIPCDNEVDVCNHGDTSFFGDLTVGYWPDNDNQMAAKAPLMSPEGTCNASNISLAPGRCATLTCAVPAGTYTLMVDPEDTLSECDDRRSDNWSVDDDRSCLASTSTTTRLEAEDYTDYSNNVTGGGSDLGRGGDDGFVTCGDSSGCGYNAGWLKDDDWIEWTYTAPDDGMYNVDVRLASGVASWGAEIAVDGNAEAALTGSNTGGWTTWRTFQSTSFYMTEGTHTIRLTPLDSINSQSINYIEVHSPRILDDVVVETETYEAVCPDGTYGLWGLLGWDAETPDNSTVTFEGVVADTAADLAVAMADPTAWAPLGEAQSQAMPNTEICGVSSSCVVDITETLGLSANQGQHFGLRISVDPDIADTTLRDWAVTYSCVYDQ